MKKWMRTLLLGAAFTVLLCTSALAAGEKGMYDVNGTGVTLVPQTAAQGTPGSATVNIDGVGSKTISVDAERIAMTVTSPVEGREYLVFVLKGDTTTPTVDNIVYIDQKSGTAAGNFDLYPSSLSNGTYTVCMSTTSAEVAQVGAFGYYASYKLGDVNSDTKIDSMDAYQVLRHYAKQIVLAGNELSAADVNADTKIDSMDAYQILRFYAKQIESFN